MNETHKINREAKRIAKLAERLAGLKSRPWDSLTTQDKLFVFRMDKEYVLKMPRF